MAVYQVKAPTKVWVLYILRLESKLQYHHHNKKPAASYTFFFSLFYINGNHMRHIVIAYDNLCDSVDELAQTVGMPGLSISTSRASTTLKASVKSPQNNKNNLSLSSTRSKRKTNAAAAAAAASLILRGGANKPEHDAAYRKMFNPSKSMNSIAFLTYQTDRAHQTHRARVSRGLTNRVHIYVHA